MTDLAPIGDLLAEVADKNSLMVVKYEAKTLNGRTTQKEVFADNGETPVIMTPGLFRQDRIRMLAGKKPIYAKEAFRRYGGDLVDLVPNLRTNVGIDFVTGQLGNAGSAASTSAADWIALTSYASGASATHASSTVPWSSAQTTDAAGGEFTTLATSSFARKVATQAHTASATSYTLTATWTATGAVTALVLAGNFGGSSKNTQGSSANNVLMLETAFTSTTLGNGDSLQLTWTVNV